MVYLWNWSQQRDVLPELGDYRNYLLSLGKGHGLVNDDVGTNTELITIVFFFVSGPFDIRSVSNYSREIYEIIIHRSIVIYGYSITAKPSIRVPHRNLGCAIGLFITLAKNRGHKD